MNTDLDDDELDIEERLRRGLRRRPMSAELGQRLAAPIHSRYRDSNSWRGRLLNAVAAVVIAVAVGYVLLPVGKLPESPPARTAAEDPAPKTEDTKPEPEPIVSHTLSIQAIIDGVLTGERKYILFPELGRWMSGKDESASVDKAKIAERVSEIMRTTLGREATVVAAADSAAVTVTGVQRVCLDAARLVSALAGDTPADPRRVVMCEFSAYAGLDKLDQLFPGLDLSPGKASVLTPDALNSFQAGIAARKKSALLAVPRMTMFPGVGGSVSVSTQHSYITDYDISGGVFDPVIGAYHKGVRIFARGWILPSGGLRFSTRISVCDEVSPPQIVFIEAPSDAPANKDDKPEKKRFPLPVEVPALSIRQSPMITEDLPPGGAIAIRLPNPTASEVGLSPEVKDKADPKKAPKSMLIIARARVVNTDEGELPGLEPAFRSVTTPSK